jgi:hypothetical protein
VCVRVGHGGFPEKSVSWSERFSAPGSAGFRLVESGLSRERDCRGNYTASAARAAVSASAPTARWVHIVDADIRLLCSTPLRCVSRPVASPPRPPELQPPGSVALQARQAPRTIGRSLRAPNTMKHTLRCHDFGLMACSPSAGIDLTLNSRNHFGQNRASPQGVAVIIAASFVARLANTASIGCTSLLTSDDSASQRTRVSSC